MGYENYKISDDGTIDRNRKKSIDGTVLFFEVAWILSVLFMVLYFGYALLSLYIYVDEVPGSPYISWGDDLMPFSLCVHSILTVILVILKIIQYKRNKRD